jgi:hypothetical protein
MTDNVADMARMISHLDAEEADEVGSALRTLLRGIERPRR